MGFSRTAAARAAQTLRTGDQCFLYTTRGCFHNPNIDRGRVMGCGIVLGPVQQIEPVSIGRFEITHACPLEIRSVAPFRSGVDLGPLVPQLEVFPDPTQWAIRLRTTTLSLPEPDARTIA